MTQTLGHLAGGDRRGEDLEALRREVERLRVCASSEAPAILEAILRHSPHGIIICDAQGRLTLQNRAAERIWGGSATAESVADWRQYRAFHRDGRPYGPDDWGMARCLKHREVHAAEEVWIERFDGTRALLLCSSAPILAANDELHGALAVFADITELQDAIRGREENEKRLQLITDALPVLVSFVDHDERYQFANAAYERWFGLKREDIVGKSLREVVGEAAYQCMRPHVEAALAGQTVRYEALMPYREGGERFVEATCIPQVGPHGVSGYVALVADVSERMRLQRENAEARSRAEQLYAFAHAAMKAERVEDVLEAALESIGRALGTQRTAILLFDGEGVMRFRAWRGLSEDYRRRVEGHSPWPDDVMHPEPILVPDANGEPTLASYRELFQREGISALAFIPIVTRGQLLGKFMVYYDRTHDFSQHEIGLSRAIANHLASVIARFSALAALQETVRYNEIFAGVLAHDLRNPLGGMMTAAQLLLHRQQGESERVVKPLSRILSSGERMTRMIDQLLDFTRVRVGGTIEIQPRPGNLADLCCEVLGELELVNPDWRIEKSFQGELTGTWDGDRLLQIISNLVANAGEHGKPGTTITIEADGRHPDVVTLAVHNQGTIPPDLRSAIFDPFRSTRHRRDKSRGLGLGLFIVKEIVSAHGGTVDVLSSDEGGTRFTLRLPRHARARPGGDGGRRKAPAS